MNEMGKAGTVLIRDQVGVREKLKSLIAGGPKNMQVWKLKCNYVKFNLHLNCIYLLQGIFDFDGTITRGVYKGERAQTSFCIMAILFHIHILQPPCRQPFRLFFFKD